MKIEKLSILWPVARLLYSSLLRGLLEKAVESTENNIDDLVVNACDLIFEYEKKII